MKKQLCLLMMAAVGFSACKKPDQINITDGSSHQTYQKLAGTVTVTMNAATDILDNGYGYNTRFPDTYEPWGSNSMLWTKALDSSFANVIRYPGGTVANFWQAGQTKLFSAKSTADPDGWIDPNKTGFDFINNVIVPGNQKKNSLADLSTAVSTTGCSVVFVLNLVTPGKDFYASPQGWNRTINDNPPSTTGYTTPTTDDWYKMLDNRYLRTKNMLIKAHQNNIPIRYIELGNECYLANSTYYKEVFPKGQDYAIAANYIINKLKNDPDLNLATDVKFSVPGAAEKKSFNSTRILNWNSQLLSKLDASQFDYITLHSYQEADTLLTNYNSATDLYGNIAKWYNDMNTSLADKSANSLILASGTGWHVWWNELSPGQKGPVVEGKWGSILTELFAALWSIDNKGVNYMHPNFDANDVVDEATGALQKQGYALIPLMRATKGCTKARLLNFPGLATMGNTGKTVVQGYYFTDNASNKKSCIVNFSDQVVTLDLSNVFTSNTQLTISGQKNAVNDSDMPTHIGDHTDPTNSVILEPYSVSFIRP